MQHQREGVGCDLLVLGSGMAGMTAAATVAAKGAKVIVVEKAATIGGSAALSGGYVWTCTSRGHMARNDDGDPRLHAVVVDEYPTLMDGFRARGIDVHAPQRVLYGRGQQVDLLGHFKQTEMAVEAAGGHIVRATETIEFTKSGRRVSGALTRHADGEMEVRADAVLLATGGFQGSPELRAKLIHPAARDMVLRSNSTSSGDGLRLGVAAGGSNGGPNPGFYGHLLAHPVTAVTPAEFINFTQYHSDHALLLNREGRRFVDESRADHASTQSTLRQTGARALLVWDTRVQNSVAVVPPVAGAVPVDRFAMAIAAGARGVMLERLADIVAIASQWGYAGACCHATIDSYNAAMRMAPEAVAPAREDNAIPLDRAPFYALEVQPAITFSYGGLSVDENARVLDPAGQAVDGLFAAGADVGNVYRAGYGGGLALAGTFAIRAMRTLGYVT